MPNSKVQKADTTKKRPTKKTGSRGSAGSGKHRTRQKKRRTKRERTPWWAWPVTILMLLILCGVAAFIEKERVAYAEFVEMRKTVNFEGFYNGITIDGRDVSAQSLSNVLNDLRTYEESLKAQINLNIVYLNQQRTITADDLGYQSDYESVVRQAYQIGREGNARERYRAIRALRDDGSSFTITRGFDESRLRTITDEIAASLTRPAINARVEDFDTQTLQFTFSKEEEGYAVDADQLYQSALAALRSGVGGQNVVVSQQVIQPTAFQADLERTFGQICEARTSTSGSNENRLKNIELALSTINGVCVQPGEVFSFNDTVGQRTADRGYKSAGAFVDGLLSEEVGGGICQVSTTLFNAVAKADLTITARQPHSRPVGYIDKGKDAAVSWPNQDFKFTNETQFPVFIVAHMSETRNRCIISFYGQQLPDGMSISIESEVTEVLEPGEDEYRYTRSLPTGQKKKVESAREGYRAVTYKVYQDKDGNEIRRELLCNSYYAPSGAVYNVGQ